MPRNSSATVVPTDARTEAALRSAMITVYVREALLQQARACEPVHCCAYGLPQTASVSVRSNVTCTVTIRFLRKKSRETEPVR